MKRLGLLVIWLGCGLGALVSWLWMLCAIPFATQRAWRLALGFDRVSSAATGGLDTETISSRAGRGEREGIWYWCLLCRMLDWIQKDHCKNSIGT